MDGKEEDDLGLKLEFRIEVSEHEAAENRSRSLGHLSRA
jgi:hypothetical protein